MNSESTNSRSDTSKVTQIGSKAAGSRRSTQDRILIVPLKRQFTAPLPSSKPALRSAHTITFEEVDVTQHDHSGDDDDFKVMVDFDEVEKEVETAVPENSGKAHPPSRSLSETMQIPPLTPEAVEITPTLPQAADGDNPEDDYNLKVMDDVHEVEVEVEAGDPLDRGKPQPSNKSLSDVAAIQTPPLMLQD